MKLFTTLILLINIIYAHPHTFIEVYPTIIVKDNNTEKIDFIWKLDEMTSSMLIMEFDSNQNGKLDKEEQSFVYENYFTTLIDYNFYTDITVNDKIQKFPKPTNFNSFIENNRLCYSFTIKENINTKNTLFDFGDTDFFVAMILKKEFVSIKGAKAIVSDLDNDFYFGYRLEFK